MNKLESDYAQVLEGLRRDGEIAAYRYEPFKLKMADKTWYNPDFLVIRQDGVVEFHETKGFMRDDAMVKLKATAALYPWFEFILVQKKKGAFTYVSISGNPIVYDNQGVRDEQQVPDVRPAPARRRNTAARELGLLNRGLSANTPGHNPKGDAGGDSGNHRRYEIQ